MRELADRHDPVPPVLEEETREVGPRRSVDPGEARLPARLVVGGVRSGRVVEEDHERSLEGHEAGLPAAGELAGGLVVDHVAPGGLEVLLVTRPEVRRLVRAPDEAERDRGASLEPGALLLACREAELAHRCSNHSDSAPGTWIDHSKTPPRLWSLACSICSIDVIPNSRFLVFQ